METSISTKSAVALVVALAATSAGVSACGGSSTTAAPTKPTTTAPTPESAEATAARVENAISAALPGGRWDRWVPTPSVCPTCVDMRQDTYFSTPDSGITVLLYPSPAVAAQQRAALISSGNAFAAIDLDNSVVIMVTPVNGGNSYNSAAVAAVQANH